MGEEKSRSVFLYLLLALLWGFTFFMGVIRPPFLSYYTFDETFIADSGVFLWYGITPRILDWPASPSVILFALIFGVSAGFQLLLNLSKFNSVPEAFQQLDQVTYEYLFNREPYLLTARALQMLIVLGVLILTLRFLLRQNHALLNNGGWFLIGAVVAGSHIFWNSAPVLRPEAIAGVVFIYILCRLVFTDRIGKYELMLLSLLFGLVCAQRLIFLILAPLFFSGVVLRSAAPGKKPGLISIGVFSLAFLACCPFIISDPMILSKAFLGGIFAKVTDSQMSTFFNNEFIRTFFDHPTNYLALALTFLGLYRLAKEKNVFYWVLIGNWLIFLLLVLRSSKIYDPHVMPAALINLVIMGVGLRFLSELRFEKSKYLVWGILGIFLVGEALMVLNYHFWVRRDNNSHQAIRWIKQEVPDHAKVLTNIEIGLHLSPDNQALSRWVAATSNKDAQLKKLAFLMGLGPEAENDLLQNGAPIAMEAFAFEDESLFELQYRLLQMYGRHESRKTFNMDIYLDDITLFTHGIETPKAKQSAANGNYDFFITHEKINDTPLIKEFVDADGDPVRIYGPRHISGQ